MNSHLIAGVDEAGRGPLAGPVVASAVILNDSITFDALNDSKQLNEKQRTVLATQIRCQALSWSIGIASPREIDEHNILNATLLAMERAVNFLSISPSTVWIDGLHIPTLSIPTQAFIRGDQLYQPISAASILAKVFRDDLMQKYHIQYPEYGFDQHKGYGTLAHRQALIRYGPTAIHRYSFKPIRPVKVAINELH